MSKEETPEEILNRLTLAAAELGWVVAMDESEDGEIQGIIVGPLDFTVNVIQQLSDAESFNFYEPAVVSKEGLH